MYKNSSKFYQERFRKKKFGKYEARNYNKTRKYKCNKRKNKYNKRRTKSRKKNKSKRIG